jgi:hypothetical protein
MYVMVVVTFIHPRVKVARAYLCYRITRVKEDVGLVEHAAVVWEVKQVHPVFAAVRLGVDVEEINALRGDGKGFRANPLPKPFQGHLQLLCLVGS